MQTSCAYGSMGGNEYVTCDMIDASQQITVQSNSNLACNTNHDCECEVPQHALIIFSSLERLKFGEWLSALFGKGRKFGSENRK